MTSIQQARTKAAVKGQMHFKCPKPCKDCGSDQRYVKSNQCVSCTKARSAQQSKDFRALIDAARKGK